MSDTYARTDVSAFLAAVKDTPLARVEAYSAVEVRALIAAARQQQPESEIELPVVSDFDCPGPAGPIPSRLFDPRTERSEGCGIVFLHGGGFVFGDLDSHASICAQIALASDLPVISVGYRLAPEDPWPAGPDDAEAAARWLAGPDAAPVVGRKFTNLIIAGDSAGANLAAVTARALALDPAEAPVIAQWLFYPVTGSRTTPSRTLFEEGYLLTRAALAWFEKAYSPAVDGTRYDLMTDNLEIMPPTLLVTAGLDPLRDEGRAYAAALTAAGVEVVFQEAKGNIHGFLGLGAAIPSSLDDIRRALLAVKFLTSVACR